MLLPHTCSPYDHFLLFTILILISLLSSLEALTVQHSNESTHSTIPNAFSSRIFSIRFHFYVDFQVQVYNLDG